MRQQELINDLLKLIEEKQNNGEFGAIRIEFRSGFIVDVNENRTRKIKVKKEGKYKDMKNLR